jgi:FkbM family methyltransferase
MNFLKRIIFKIVGVKTYLIVISRLFFMAYYSGFLKGKKLFDCHYFVKKLIKKGDSVIDLGANLGYYTLIFSKLTGKSGKVYSIEPVELFRSVLTRNTRNQLNIEIFPYAIGNNDNERIKMGVPVTSTYFSHGRTHVLSSEEECSMVFEATVMRPETIFTNLKRLDYLKCDIEGYENIAIPLFQELLIKFKPILQIEIADENRIELISFLKGLDYSVFEVKGDKLIGVFNPEAKTYGDLIFIDSIKTSQFTGLIGN